jgi:hypothetical protein
MAPRIGIMACSMLTPELKAVARNEQWQDVEIIPLPCQCLAGSSGDQPTCLSPPAQLSEDLDLHLIGCPSPQPWLDEVPWAERVTSHHMDTCFKLFLPSRVIDQYTCDGAYLTTPGWLSDWRGHLDELGFSDEGIKEFFGEFARQVVFIDTGTGENAAQDCAEFCEHVGLPCLTIPAGLDLATLILRVIVQGARLNQEIAHTGKLKRLLHQEVAQGGLLLEMQSELSSLHQEEQVIQKIQGIFTVMYSPGEVAVVSLQNGDLKYSHPPRISEARMVAIKDFLTEKAGRSYAFLPGEEGFIVRFGESQGVNGAALLTNFIFPENRDQYLNQTLSLAPVFKLVIDRARALHGILPVCSFCHQIKDRHGVWQRFEEYISQRTEALFSHSVCPGCFKENYPELVSDPDQENQGA